MDALIHEENFPEIGNPLIFVNGVWQELAYYEGPYFTVRQADGALFKYQRLRLYTDLDFQNPARVPPGFNRSF